jgi:uncharacterized membrane protein YccC
MPKFNRHALLFSLNSFAASMLALYIALALGLPRPYWAMATAYIVSQPLSGAVRSKAIYRLAGTILGAAVAVLLVPSLVDSPALLCIALSLWVAGCLVVSLLDRTPRSYLLMLAGYTAALIGFPSVNQPGAIFDVAAARVVEIGLGILCASLVHSLVFPRPVGSALQARLDDWLDEAERWALDVLRGAQAGDTQRDRTRLALAASEIHMLASHLPFDTSRLRDTRAAVRALRDRMLLLIPLLSGTGDRLQALLAEGALEPQVQSHCEEVAQWIEAGAEAAAGEALSARLRAQAEGPHGGDWPALLTSSLLVRLAETVAALGDSRALLAHLRDPAATPASRAVQAIETARRRPLHSDLSLAFRSGATAIAATLICCALWIGLGWPDGATAAMMAAVFCCFYASLDDPAPQIANFAIFTLAALPAAALYLFAILPAISGFPLLVVVLAPTLLLLGLYVAEPATMGLALPFVMTFCNALALQETFNADLPSFLNGNLAQLVGAFVSIAATQAMRSMSAEASIRRLLARTWRGLARMARTGAAPEPGDFAGLLVDRLALLSPKLADAGGRPDGAGEAALADLRVAMNLVAVLRARPQLAGASADRLDGLSAALAEHFAALARSGRAAPEAGVLLALDRALAAVAPATGEASRIVTVGLVGLRRNLFPAAAPFTAVRSEAAA